ncbi:methyl-accepting chemotaxis protein [Bacillus sp. MUM 13]|uniref:methyl-accepting chemotaxis protein n=1 Tax=Bacillus sp. MUM 13 TaxID=1678001 RepID=UPI0008F5D162|nr:methyl-accepting chemotaxis protein [Bacillus sp. MUM 13]OIK09774.1 chemotaxis protein [Bacillus sp. MUM 13]
MIKKLSLRNKILIIVFITVLILTGILSGTSIYSLKQQMQEDLQHELSSVGLLTEKNLNPEQIHQLLSVSSKDDFVFKNVQKQLDSIKKEQGIMSWSYIWKPEQGGFAPIGYTSDLNEIYKPGQLFKDIAPIHLKTAKLAISSGKPQVTDIFKDSFGTWRTVFTPVTYNGEIIAVLGIDYSAEYINKSLNSSTLNQILISLAGLIVMMSLLYFVINRLLRPLKKMVGIADSIAKGDLTVDINMAAASKDEVGRLSGSIGEMVKNLNGLITNIHDTSSYLAASAEELSANASETYEYSMKVSDDVAKVAKGNEITLRTTEESAAAIEETAYGIQKIAGSSFIVSESSTLTSREAKDGNYIIQRLIQQMSLINTSVNQIGSAIIKLNDNTTKIDDFVRIISDIANQTNLLALNAAIEAARAGEHGKGFAVVADEVRKLAEQSASSATQITELIRDIQQDSASSISVMEEGEENVEAGLKLTNEAGEVFKRILESAEEVAMQIHEVSAASEQISASSEEVAASVNEMKATAQSTSEFSGRVSDATYEQLSSMEEIKATSNSLGKTAEELQELVGKFKI